MILPTFFYTFKYINRFGTSFIAKVDPHFVLNKKRAIRPLRRFKEVLVLKNHPKFRILAIAFISISIISLINAILIANIDKLITSSGNILGASSYFQIKPQIPFTYDENEDLSHNVPEFEISNEDCSCYTLHDLSLTEPYMVSDDVAELQGILMELGYMEGEADGVFGPATESSVKRFQKNNGYEQNGIVDEDIWAALGEAFEKAMGYESTYGFEDPNLEVTAVGTSSNKIIVVDTSSLTLTLFEDGKVAKTYTVGVGNPSTPSPLGDYKIVSKKVWAGGFGSRWMGMNVKWGNYGIHGTNKPWSIGQRQSGGCIRMLNKDVIDLYSRVDVGTPVKIIGGGIGDHGMGAPEIEPGEKGWHVLIVQKRLAELGYYSGPIDGSYGISSEKAVIQFQKDNNISPSGVVGPLTYTALHLSAID